MSHELKTPLNAIIGFSDLLQMVPEQFSREQIGEYAGLIHTAGNNLLKLINQILDLTKIAARRFPLQLTSIAVGGALWIAIDTMREKAEQKSIALSIEDLRADLIATGRRNRALPGIVGQLVENAAELHARRRGRVHLRRSERRRLVQITVAGQRPRRGAPTIWRASWSLSSRPGRGIADHAQGAGLGLPLAKALAELHGGTLSIASTQGCRLHRNVVELPLLS